MRRLFIGYCWGAAGTTWLARALNSHPDVFALHAPMTSSGRPAASQMLDVVRQMFVANDIGGAYPVAGYTHGIGTEHHDALEAEFGRRLRAFVLTRHPVSRVRSHAALLAELRRRQGPGWRTLASQIRRTTRRLRAIEPNLPTDEDSAFFYQSCSLVGSITRESQIEIPFVRCEDLFTDVDALQSLFDYVSDGLVETDTDTLSRLQGIRVGVHAPTVKEPGEVWDALPDHLRAAFEIAVTPQARELYEGLGYELPVAS